MEKYAARRFLCFKRWIIPQEEAGKAIEDIEITF